MALQAAELQAAAPTENLTEPAAAAAAAEVPPADQPALQAKSLYEQMLRQALQPSALSRGVLGEMNQLANDPSVGQQHKLGQQQPEVLTQQAQLPQHLEGHAPISPLRRR